MILDFLLKDPEALSRLAQAISNMHQSNAFGALLEVGMNRSVATPTDHPMEVAALRAAWKDGYAECLSDLANFFPRFVNIPKQNSPTRDFGSLDILKDRNDITEEEYREFKSTYPV